MSSPSATAVPVATGRKRILSGMKPTGTGRLHLGNYEGALKPWVRLQDQYEMFCFVADWHGLTILNEANAHESIADKSRQIAIDYLSAGLDPEKPRSFFLYAGAGTIPGIGLPMCLISAELVLKRLRGDRSTTPLPVDAAS